MIDGVARRSRSGRLSRLLRILPVDGSTDMLKKDFICDGNRKIIGSVTTGFDDTTAVVRDKQNRIAGRTNEGFDTTRDSQDGLVSINSADPGLLIGRKK